MQNEEVIVESNQPAPAAEEPKAEPVAEGEAQEGDKLEETETPEQAEAKKQSKFKRRLERQKTARIAAETRAQMLEERLAKIEAERAPKPQDAAPKRDDFPDDVQYLEALTDYKADQKVKAALSERDKQSEGRQQQSKVAESWTKAEASFKATAEDYEDTVTPFVEDELQQYSAGAKRAIVESDVGPQLLYHLATHAEDAERIAGLSPLQQIKELGKLEDKMSRPVKRASNAPPPPNPVKGGTSGSKDPAKMSVAEYAKWMADNGSRFVRKAA